MRVRPATIDDAPAIAGVHIRTWQRGYAHALPAGYLASLNLGARIEMWQEIITGTTAPGQTYVAAVASTVAGFISIGRYRSDDEPSIGQVYALYADPDHWSTGVGRALMQVAIAHGTEAGFTEIRLWVLEDNPRARRFYELAGFQLDGAKATDIIGDGSPYATEVVEVRYALAIPR